MTQSVSAQPWFNDPPTILGDADAWARWAVEFLDGFCRMWNDWRETWKYHYVPDWQPGNQNAYLTLERYDRQVGHSRKLETGSPPPSVLAAPPLLDACSRAIQRFSAQLAWRFDKAEQADEIAQGLLAVASAIQNRRYHEIAQANLERLSQLVKMATRRAERNEDPPVGDTPRRRRRGRKPDTDPKADAGIAKAWATRQYRTYADLERELNLPVGEAKRACDRHRKRK